MLFLHFFTVFRSKRAVSTIFPPCIMTNRNYERRQNILRYPLFNDTFSEGPSLASQNPQSCQDQMKIWNLIFSLNVTLKMLLNIKIGSDCISCFIYIYASNIRCNIHFMFGCIFPSFSFNKKSMLFYLWIMDNVTYHIISSIYNIYKGFIVWSQCSSQRFSIQGT